MGAVVVLNDVTRLRRLEKTRRDFVANVSHELRTPVTSIKGFVETLKDGALEDPEDAHRFVDIIARQADRLDAIIEDLLALARIEREHEGEEIDRYPTRVLGVVESAFFSVQGKADDRQVTLRSEGDPDLEAWINPPLLEQAIVNLVDNAVKYSDQQTTVLVRVEGEGEELAVRVIDEGHGISAEHLPRLFERFYRVDKGRSRAEGGTGLGLAIVKHIAIAHGGSVEVDSVPGEGTTFTLRLPREPRPTSQLSLLRQE
jgi:two-component system phosphate regulon sensor histidine kinase PhoR